MAITYTWDILAIERTAEGAVTKVIADLVGTDSDASYKMPCTTTLGPIDPDNFVPFDELTPEILGGWIAPEIGGDRLRSMKAQIASTVTAMLAPESVTVAPPWVPAPAPIVPPESPVETPEGEEEPA